MAEKKFQNRLLDKISRTARSGTTKFWLPDSRRCRKHQQRYPQLVELTTDSISTRNPWYNRYNRWKTPPPKLRNIDTIVQFASTRSYRITENCQLVLTGNSNPAFMVYYYPTLYYNVKEKPNERRVVTHKSTEIDPYDAYNEVMSFSYVIKSADGKYYAVSLQGALVVMEQVDDERIIITGICSTRAVPSSPNAKLFTEYLFESKGEILVLFLNFKESIDNLADEIEVFRFDLETMKLVKVDSLQGRALLLEDERCVCVDSKKVGCKGDSVYFTMEGKWRVYDMKNGSVSDNCCEQKEE